MARHIAASIRKRIERLEEAQRKPALVICWHGQPIVSNMAILEQSRALHFPVQVLNYTGNVNPGDL